MHCTATTVEHGPNTDVNLSSRHTHTHTNDVCHMRVTHLGHASWCRGDAVQAECAQRLVITCKLTLTLRWTKGREAQGQGVWYACSLASTVLSAIQQIGQLLAKQTGIG